MRKTVFAFSFITFITNFIGIHTKIIHYIKFFSIGLFLRLKYDKIFLKYK